LDLFGEKGSDCKRFNVRVGNRKSQDFSVLSRATGEKRVRSLGTTKGVILTWEGGEGSPGSGRRGKRGRREKETSIPNKTKKKLTAPKERGGYPFSGGLLAEELKRREYFTEKKKRAAITLVTCE